MWKILELGPKTQNFLRLSIDSRDWRFSLLADSFGITQKWELPDQASNIDSVTLYLTLESALSLETT